MKRVEAQASGKILLVRRSVYSTEFARIRVYSSFMNLAECTTLAFLIEYEEYCTLYWLQQNIYVERELDDANIRYEASETFMEIRMHAFYLFIYISLLSSRTNVPCIIKILQKTFEMFMKNFIVDANFFCSRKSPAIFVGAWVIRNASVQRNDYVRRKINEEELNPKFQSVPSTSNSSMVWSSRARVEFLPCRHPLMNSRQSFNE